MDITIGYDVSSLTNPRVVQGGLVSGGIMVSNTTVPGSVHIAMVKANGISGAGSIATISFDQSGGIPGKILSLNAKLVDSKGAKIASQSQIYNPAETTSSLPQTTSDTVSAARPAWLGTVTMPSDTASSSNEKTRQEPSSQQIPFQPEQKSAEAAQKPDIEMQSTDIEPPPVHTERKTVIHKSVLKRFQDYRGERTPQALIALFKQSAIPDMRQEPPIALSDGKSTIRVFIESASVGNEALNFLLKGAKLASLKMEGNNTYLLEILPEPKGYEATVTVLRNDTITEFPLTIAPPLVMKTGDIEILGTENFKAFLKRSVTEKAFKSDLNGDGVWNYIDEYILTANFLVRNKAGLGS
ncbi:MAG: cohesin domain-containing protein [Geobacteraceae bacterium]